MESIEKIKEDFENGKIKEEDIDIDTQKELAKLYKEEIENNRKEIFKIREEIDMYKQKIKKLKKE